jgi:hypothetical protein
MGRSQQAYRAFWDALNVTFCFEDLLFFRRAGNIVFSAKSLN